MWIAKNEQKRGKYTSENCVICLEPSKDPIFLKCGHSFCEDCINAYIAECRKKLDAKCPLCREKIYGAHPIPCWPSKNYIFLGFLLTAAFFYIFEKGKSSVQFTS